MDSCAIPLVIGFVALFALLIYWSIRNYQKTEAQKRETASGLGFTPIKEPDHQLVERIEALYRSPQHKQFRLRNVARKLTPDGEMYLFDLSETSGEDSTTLAEQGVAMFSSRLNLPRFTLSVKPDTGGAMMGLADRFMKWAFSMIGRPIDFSQYPAFNERYFVTGPDAAAVQALIDDRLADRLARIQPYNIEAGWDGFAVSRSIYRPATQTANPSQIIRETMGVAQELYAWFADRQAAGGQLPHAASSRVNPPPASPPLTHCPRCGAELSKAADSNGVTVCAYCNSAFLLTGEPADEARPEQERKGPPARPPAYEQDAARPFTSRVTNRSSGCMIPFGMVWTLFSALFVVIGVGTYLADQQQYNLLTREGKTARATLTERYIDEDSEGDTYYVSYRFEVPAQGDLSPVSARQSVSRKLYEGFEVGQTVEVIYAPSDPGVSELKATFGPPQVMLPLCFTGMGGLFVVIGLVMVYGGVVALFKK